MVLAMQRQELKTLAVSFSPYHTGPVTGKITIKHYTRDGSDPQQYKKVCIMFIHFNKLKKKRLLNNFYCDRYLYMDMVGTAR